VFPLLHIFCLAEFPGAPGASALLPLASAIYRPRLYPHMLPHARGYSSLRKHKYVSRAIDGKDTGQK
jgi:hypothetical protein